jgi:tetratricopeptide (TPR) repeat protein
MAQKKRKKKSQPLATPQSAAVPAGRYGCRVREILILIIMATVVFGIYSNTLQNPFVLDDLSNIQYNSHIRLTRLNFEGIKQAGFESPLSNRPVAYVSFALNYYIHQLNVAGYHTLNIVIHIACGICLFLLIKTTFNSPALASRSQPYTWVPFLTALIWLVHPIQTQSVTYVVQRMNSLAAMFYVLSVLLYARARQTDQPFTAYAQYAGCIISGLLALGSKEIAATLPATIFLYEWYFQQDLSWIWLKRRILPIAAVLAFFTLMALSYLDFQPLDKILDSYGGRDFTVIQRVLTEFRVIVFYISLILLPHPSRLNLDHHFSVSHSLFDPVSTILAIGFIAGMVALALYSARKHRLISFCILWYLGNLIIESSVIGLEIIFEHRNYMPSMLFILLIVLLVYQFNRLLWLKTGVLAVIVLVLCIWTFDRNDVWRDTVSLWQDCAAKSPHKARPHNNLAVALVRRGDFDAAIANYRKALQIEPDYAEAHFNLATLLRRQGKLTEAVNHYRETLRLKPDYSGGHNNLGAVLHEQGKIGQAMAHYSEALRLRPDYARAHFNMAMALKARGKLEEAISHFTEALQQDPGHVGAHYQLAQAHKKAGNIPAAIAHFKAAIRLKPDYAEAHFSMGVLRYQQGRIEAAMGHYVSALKIKPDYPEAHNNLGAALDDLGKRDEAVFHYREALRLKPDYSGAHNNLGIALAMAGNFNEAISHFSEALRISPDDAQTHSNQAHALASLGRYEAATRHYHAALAINPNDTEVQRGLAKALKQLGR